MEPTMLSRADLRFLLVALLLVFTVVTVLNASSYYAALLAPPATDLPTAEYLSAEDEQAPAAAAAPSKGSGTGLGFMIGGGVAFVGGLLMGGTRG
jgi:hypothetical protein